MGFVANTEKTFVQVVKKMLRPCPRFFFFLVPTWAQFSGFWAEEAGTVGTSGRKRGASAQANCRDSRARETGPQI